MKFPKIPLREPAQNSYDTAEFTLKRPMADQCRDAMKVHDIDPPEIIYADGKLHRFKGTGKGGKQNGWYVIHDYCGNFGDWKITGSEGINFSADFERELTDAEREQIALQNEATKKAVQQEIEEKQAEVAKWAQEKWDSLKEASIMHPYLQNKGIHSTFGLRMDGSSLVMPIYDFYGKITTLQFINPNGSKHLTTGGRAKGCFWYVGKGDVEYIAEGFATAASIAQETGRCCAVALMASNLPIVGSYFPNATIVVDDDDPPKGQTEGAGLKYARQSRNKYILCSRELSNNPHAGYDANDLMVEGGDLCGLLGVKKAEKHFRTLEEVIVQKEPVKWLIHNIIPAGNKLMMVFGASGEGKTYFVIDWMLSIVTGRSWNGYRVKKGNVLYLCGEGQETAYERMRAWIQYYKESPFGASMAIDEHIIPLDKEKGVADLIGWIEDELPEHEPDFMCIDTLNLYMEGDENDTKESNAFIKGLKMLSDKFNCCICLVHHKGVSEGASNRSRGSSVYKGALDCQIMITKENGRYIFTHVKNKAGAEVPSMEFSLSLFTVDGWFDDYGEPRTNGVMLPIAKVPTEFKQGGQVIETAGYTADDLFFLQAFDQYKEVIDNQYVLTQKQWTEWVRKTYPEEYPKGDRTKQASQRTNPTAKREANRLLDKGQIGYNSEGKYYFEVKLNWAKWHEINKINNANIIENIEG